MSKKPVAFRWKRNGRIFVPDGRHSWMESYAQNPSVLPLEDRLRVFFNCRPKQDSDGNYTSLIAYVDVDRINCSRILAVSDTPVLGLGATGTFDQFGVMAGCVLKVDSEVWLYYVGWARCQGVPYDHSIGLAISRDGKTFERFATGPILDSTPAEPFIQNSPFVCVIGSELHMWYSSGLRWMEHEGRMESIYVLMHATSEDGKVWKRDGVPCMPFVVDDECQTNPTLLKAGGRYHMWFCYRYGVGFRNAQRGYRMGYAWSEDLVQWHREDEASELLPSRQGWDTEMVCYPCVVNVDDNVHMFYSGNYFGRDGFGYATLC